MTPWSNLRPSPSVTRPTADGGTAAYWYPDPSDVTVYTCLETFADGEVVAAWSNGRSDGAVDLGMTPDAEAVARALAKMDVERDEARAS